MWKNSKCVFNIHQKIETNEYLHLRHQDLGNVFFLPAFRFKNTKNYRYLLGQTPLRNSLLRGNYYPDVRVDHCFQNLDHIHMYP